MSKPFFSYQQQMDKLVNEKNLVVGDWAYAEDMLRCISYFALISGYKDPYRNPTTQKYKDGTTFEEIVALYKFDENLRELFLKYLLKIERHMRSMLSYYFAEAYGDSQAAYLSAASYNSAPKFRRGIVRLINKLDQTAKSTEYPYIHYQRSKYNNVPLWVLVNALTFGSLSKMYQFLPSHLQSKVSKNFPKVNEKELQQYLAVLTKFRNVCAHNERLFSYKTTDSIPNTVLHQKTGHSPKRDTVHIW